MATQGQCLRPVEHRRRANFLTGSTGDLPSATDQVSGGGFLGRSLYLSEAASRGIDLGSIGVGEAFTIECRLFVYASDRGSHLGYQRGALAHAKDPLGEFGLSFTATSGGGTAPVPLPAGGALLAAGLGLMLRAGTRR